MLMALSLAQLEARAQLQGCDRIPIAKTLNRYGLTRHDWLSMLNSQGWKCGCCGKERQLWNIDHRHVKGWKKMSKIQRRRYVRGILCWRCNKLVVGSRLTYEESKRITRYLKLYEERKKVEDARRTVGS